MATGTPFFPGSKRLITRGRAWSGDNTDVRPPATEELWQGGSIRVGGGYFRDGRETVRLTLDGVFFTDGSFAGANRLGSWEQTVFAAEAYLACGRFACDADNGALSSDEFFRRVQDFTGQTENGRLPAPAPPSHPEGWLRSPSVNPESIRYRERQMIGWQIFRMRRERGSEETVKFVKAWADVPVPEFRRL